MWSKIRHICAFSFLESKGRAKGEKRELGLREDQGFGGRSSYLWFLSDQEEEGRLGVEESRDSKVRN